MKPQHLASGRRPDAPRAREPEARTPPLRLTKPAIEAAVAQLVALKPTRAALAWSVASPLTPYPDAERALKQCGHAVAFDARPPAGSLGDACSAFLSTNGLKPMVLSVKDTADPARKLAVRRVLLHDLLHVLLDFKADWPGQLGVFSFVAAQRYCPQFVWAARTLGQLYMTAAPWLRDDLREAEYRGRQLAIRAPRLLSTPIEQEWETSLMALQVRLNVKTARSLGAIDWGPRAINVPAPARTKPGRLNGTPPVSADQPASAHRATPG